MSAFVLTAALRSRCGHSVLHLWFLLLPFLPFFLAYSQRSQTECLPYFHTWCGLSANLECRYEMGCTRLAENTGRKNTQKIAICICPAVSQQLRHISTIEKKLVRQQFLLHMSSQYGKCRPTKGWEGFGSLVHPSKFQISTGCILRARVQPTLDPYAEAFL